MFEIDGKQFSLERLQQEAAKYNMDFNSYMDKMRKKGLVEIDDASQSSIGVGILKSEFLPKTSISKQKIKKDIKSEKKQTDEFEVFNFLNPENPEEYNKNIKNFFNQDEESARVQLQKLLGEGYEITESNVLDVTKGRDNLTKSSLFATNLNVIKIKKGDKEITLNFAIKNLDEDMRDILYKEESEKLFNFVNETMTKGEKLTSKDTQKDILQEYNKLSKPGGPLHISGTEMDLINTEFDNPDLFNPQEEDKFFGGTKIVQPYEEQLKIAEQELINSGVKNPTKEQIEDRTRYFLKQNAIQGLYDQKASDYFNSDEVEETDLDATLKLGANIKNKITFQQKRELAEKNTKLVNDIANFEKRLLDENDDLYKAQWFLNVVSSETPVMFDIGDDEETVILKNGTVMPKYLYDSHIVSLETYKSEYKKIEENGNIVNNLISTIQDDEVKADLVKRNYNDLEKFVKTVIGGSFDIAIKGAYGMNKLSSGLVGIDNQAVDDDFINWQQSSSNLAKNQKEFQKDIAFENAFSSGNNFGRFVAQEVANQIPIFAAIGTGTAGIGLLGVSSAGEQWSQMVQEDKFWGNERSLLNKFLVSSGYGAAEIVFDRYLTLPVMQRSARTLYGVGFRDVMKNGVMGYMKEFGKRQLIYDPLLETASEGLTTLTQNIVSGRPILENMGHALFSGAMFGTAFGHVPFYKGVMMSKFSDYNSYSDYRDNLSKMTDLQLVKKKLETSLKANITKGNDISAIQGNIETVNQEIESLKSDNESILTNVDKKVSNLSKKWFDIYSDATVSQEQIRTDVENIIKDKTLNNAQKKDLIEIKRKRFDQLQQTRDILRDEKNFGNAYSAFRNSNTKEDKDRVEEILGQATTELINEGNLEPKDDAIDTRARIIFNTQEINKDYNSKKQKVKKVFPNFQNFQTVEKATNFINKLDLPDTDKQNIIDNFEQGAHGLNITMEDGSNIPMQVVENMAKADRLETRTHEVGHAFFAAAFGNNKEAFNGIAESVLQFVKERDTNLYVRLIETIEQDKDGNFITEEVLTNFLELAAEGKFDNKTKGLGFLSSALNMGVKKSFGENFDLNFDGETDAVNFLIGLGKKIKAGTLTIKDIKAVQKVVKKEKAKPGAKFSKEASDKVQRIYEDQGEAGAIDIIDQFKPIVNKIVDKRKDAPNFDRQLLTDEIETGKRGIFDLIREYKPESGVPLAAYINKFLPARAIEASKRVLGEEFTQDVTERVDIAAEEVVPTVKRKPKKKKIVLADRLDIKDEVYKSIDKILSDLNLNELTFKTLKNQIPEIIGKLFGIDPKKIVNKANITKSELQSSQMFISKNVDLLISMLPEGATASGTATGVPKTLLKAFYTKTGRAKMAKTGTKAGLAIQQKRKINRKEFLETFGIIDGKPIRTDRNTSARVLALADTLGKMITNQAVRQRAENLTIEAVNRLKDGKSRIMFSKDNVKEITSDVNKKNPQFFKLANVPDINGKPQQQLPKGPVLIQKISEKGEVTFAEGSIKLMDSLWDVDQGVTWEQHMSNRINKFLDSHPEYYNILQELLTGGIKRTAYMTVDNFQVLIPKTKKIKEADQIVNERLDYHRTLTAKEKEAGLTGKRLRKNIKTLDRSKDKNKLNNLIKFFQDMSNYLNKDNGKNMTDLWLMDELLKHSSVDQNNFFRKSAQLLGYPIDDNGNPITNQIVVEEHTPINEVIKIAMGAAIRGKVKNIKPLLESLLSQISILEVDDPSGSLKASLGQDFYEKVLPRIMSGDLKLKPGHAGIYRLMKHGVDPFKYKLLESDNTIAQEFEVDNLDVDEAKQRIIDYFEGEVTLAYNKAMNRTGLKIQIQGYNKLNNAVNKNRIMYSKPSRGITVLDFDDTLATTKSGVRATIPNPDGTPKPQRKVIFLAGGAGSGKSNVIKQLRLVDQGFKVVNSDISLEWLKKNSGLPADMRDLTKEQRSTLGKLQHQSRQIAKDKMMKYRGDGDGVIIDGTGGSMNVMKKQVQEFKDKGYDVSMLFVETSLETALERNRARKERSLLDVIVRKNHEAVQDNKSGFKTLFGNRFMEVATDNLAMKDPMPNKLVNKMDDFVSGYERKRLDAEEFANEGADLLAKGAEFDFSEFNVVMEGQTAPLFNKAMKLQDKFGNKDMFVLTARPAESAPHIFEFLKANGLNIPLKNITGLANSTSEAKALWMADKVAEGYNDFYFADDALQNVQAVQNMLDQFDVKSKVQQAKVKFSKDINTKFNDILEEVTGIESGKRFSAIKARKRGESKGKFRFFIPPSHEDFVGLLYNFLGKGKKGNKHRDFFEQALVRPLNRAYRELDTAKQSIANDYKSLNKEFKNIKKKLTKKTPDGDFTYQDAIRVYLWNKHGYNIPGLSKTDQQGLVDLVAGNAELQVYAETLNVISKQETYVNPTESWEGGDIRTDLDDATGRVGRKQFFAEFFENADIIFSQENLNKIEAAYGADMVSALKDILYRTKTGRNRPSGQNKLVNKFLNYLNGSVASTMFFNIRSAVLQQMSMVNFINFADNNIFKAAAAFANQPQYWKDWATIFNSDFMKQRRGGIKTDVNGAELAASVKDAKNPTQAAIKKLLELGFLPTQIGDNIAIATGGATFYRNRIKTYLKQGITPKEAESKAWTDFRQLAEATQQSARPDMVSQQQASPLGKVILAFQNVTSQFNRLGKKAFLDLKNRRISPEYKNASNPQFQSDLGNISRIAYYFAIQNLIFYSLQSALFMAMFDDDEEDERWLKKKERMIHGSIDSVLRGTGVWGAAIATLKNMAIKWHEQRGKGWNKDESAVLMEMLNVSPPLGIKARKLVNAEKTLNYNKKVIDEMETFDIDNPQWSATTNYIEATTNIPLNRLYNKTQNVRESLNNQHTALERALMFSGWSKWNLGIGDSEKIKEIKEKIKEDKKKKKKKTKTKSKKKKKIRYLL